MTVTDNYNINYSEYLSNKSTETGEHRLGSGFRTPMAHASDGHERLSFSAGDWLNGNSKYGGKGKNSFLAVFPWMIKAPLEAELSSFLKEEAPEGDLKTAYINAYEDHSLLARLQEADCPDELPDIVAHLGFGVPFHKEFRERFVDGGVYESFSFSSARKSLLEKGFFDPGGRYSLLAVNPMVLVVDHTRLGKRAVPSRWADILEPEYRRSVAVVGRGASANETLSLAIHREFGLDGVRKLGQAIAWSGHPAQMVKVAGRAIPDAPAISVIDYFFARAIRRQDRISIVWPEDGALAIPFIALVKRDLADESRRVSSFLTGPVASRIYGDAYFIPAHADAVTRVAESAPLKWLGWQYLRQVDLQALAAEISSVLSIGYNEVRQ